MAGGKRVKEGEVPFFQLFLKYSDLHIQYVDRCHLDQIKDASNRLCS